MKYLLFNHSTEKYTLSNEQPVDPENFDVIDLEAQKVLFGPTGSYDLVEETVSEAE